MKKIYFKKLCAEDTRINHQCRPKEINSFLKGLFIYLVFIEWFLCAKQYAWKVKKKISFPFGAKEDK